MQAGILMSAGFHVDAQGRTVPREGIDPTVVDKGADRFLPVRRLDDDIHNWTRKLSRVTGPHTATAIRRPFNAL